MHTRRRRDGTQLFQVAFLAAAAVGALLRLGALGHEPLGSAEAAAAVSAWRAATGTSPVFDPALPRPASAALFGAQHFVFWLTGGGGDVAARLAPALAGSLLVAVPWLLRGRLGRGGALSLAWLLALDPWLVGFSRVAGGAIFAVAGAWLVVLAAMKPPASVPADEPAVDGALDPARRRWSATAAVGCALLVTSGPVGWDLLVPAAMLLLLTASPARLAGDGGRRTAGAYGAGAWLGALAATTLLLATSGLVAWQGAGLVSTGLTAWLGEWSLDPRAGLSLSALLRSVGAYELLPLGLGLAGLVLLVAEGRRQTSVAPRPSSELGHRTSGIRRQGSDVGQSGEWTLALAGMLAAWLAWGGVVLLRSRGAADSWLVAQVPLLLAAAVAGERLCMAWRKATSRRQGAALVLVVGLCACGLLVLASGSLRIASPAVLASWQAFADRGLPGARDLASDIEGWASVRRGDGSRAEVVVADAGASAPILAWYLRRTRLRWGGGSVQPGEERRLRVAPAETANGGARSEGRGLYPVREIVSETEAFSLDPSYLLPAVPTR